MEREKRRALIGALRKSVAPNALLPSPSPPPPPGWITFSILTGRLMVAAFGDGIYRDLAAIDRKVDRMRNALEAHGQREAARPRQALGPLNMLAAGASTLPTGRRGLLSRTAAAPPLSPEEEKSRAVANRKADRASARLERLVSDARERRVAFFDARARVFSFIRALGLRDALEADTMDAAGNQRSVTRAAWEDSKNWERLMAERLFEAVKEWGAEAGTLCFPPSTADALITFVTERGEVGFGDIAGAMRVLGGVEIEPSHQWSSAADWFREEGDCSARAALIARKALNSERDVWSEAAKMWNAMDDEQKAPRARGAVKPDAFKYAKVRAPKKMPAGA